MQYTSVYKAKALFAEKNLPVKGRKKYSIFESITESHYHNHQQTNSELKTNETNIINNIFFTCSNYGGSVSQRRMRKYECMERS